MRAVLDAHYVRWPDDRPRAVEIALFLATARKLPVAERDDLTATLHRMAQVMGPDEVDPQTLLEATAAHLALCGSAA